MTRPMHIREILKQVDLAWWPEFLLQEAHPPADDDSEEDAPTAEAARLAEPAERGQSI